jgi:hypothetical protein
MEDVLDEDAYKVRCYGPILIVQLFTGSGQSWRSEWRPTAICRSLEVPAQR